MSISSIFIDSASLDGLHHGGLKNVSEILNALGHPDAAKAVAQAANVVQASREI